MQRALHEAQTALEVGEVPIGCVVVLGERVIGRGWNRVETTQDPTLEKQVGMLWLGKEFAQLGKEYCDWSVSRPKNCTPEAINRSAFVSWVDCQL